MLMTSMSTTITMAIMTQVTGELFRCVSKSNAMWHDVLWCDVT
jgi:hypothetical protein